MIMILSNIININFVSLNHPMSMMIFIIIQTFFIGLMIGNLMESFWLSYILLLTFMGGMLVLFIYITSIASNEMFYLKSSNMFISCIIMIMLLITLMIIEPMLMPDIMKNSDTHSLNLFIDLREMSMSLIKIYNNPTFLVTLMMMIYLFLTLLVVIKITNINQGPIRKMN
uniref:NADH-ubiquinone oxidoreductase chain 6 n=1 Tax=Algete brunneri TaxID=1634111 RepID=A0A516IMZ7_9ORTH|nr:NADH dehydrogenase subunit 6 [Algete brunneri]